MAVVMPIEVPKRKVGMNLGLQCNYNLPYTPREFEKPPYWDLRSLDDEKGSTKTAEKTRNTRSLDDSCRDNRATDTNFLENDYPIDKFYSLVQNYLQMQVTPIEKISQGQQE